MILDQVKSALPLHEVDVLDCHGHIGSWPTVHMPRSDIAQMIETMDRLGIDRLCLSPFLGCFCDFKQGNDTLAEAVRQHPQRLIGQFMINPNYPDEIVAELERCESRYGMRLIKIHPFCHEYPADGQGYRDFWEYADERETIVLTHTWESDRTCGPELFAQLASRYSKVKIILAHAGVTQKGCQEAINAARQHDNLFLDTASSQPHIGMIERFVNEVGADRVLFGSDIPLLEPAAQLGRIVYAGIREEDKEKILGLNLKRLLGE